MKRSAEDTFLDGLHALLKLVFETIFHIGLSIVQSLIGIYNRTDKPLRLPSWQSPDPPSRSSGGRASTPTNNSGQVRGSIRQTYLSTLFPQPKTQLKVLPKWKERLRQIEER
jgi:hypothetical protein